MRADVLLYVSHDCHLVHLLLLLQGGIAGVRLQGSLQLASSDRYSILLALQRFRRRMRMIGANGDGICQILTVSVAAAASSVSFAQPYRWLT